MSATQSSCFRRVNWSVASLESASAIMAAVEYERFADIYRVWSATAASARANLDFYVDAYVAADGPVKDGRGRVLGCYLSSA